MANSFKFFYQNTRGLRTKIAHGLKDIITLRNYDIVAITESWLNERFDSECIFDSDTYVTHRSDRSQRTYPSSIENADDNTQDLIGGGALIAIKRNISASRMNQWEQEVPFDNVWIRINTHNEKKIYINCIYINHNSNFDRINLYFKQLFDIVNTREPNANFVIVGDFNLSCIEWSYTTNRCIALRHEGRMANELLNTLTLTNLSQVNPITNNYNRILDLTLTNINDIRVSRTRGIVNEDPYHPAIIFSLESKQIKYMKVKRKTKLNFFKADYTSINRALNELNWNHEFDGLNTNEATNKYYNIINKIIQKFTPTISPKSNDFPNWYLFTKKRNTSNSKNVIKTNFSTHFSVQNEKK